MRIAVDTNVLAYAEGVNGAANHEQALTVLHQLSEHEVVIPAQVTGELFNVLVRKAGRSRDEALEALLRWHDAFPLVDTSAAAALRGMEIAAHRSLSIWDAVIVAVSAEAECRLLLSEDLHEGFTWGGVTVVNPFAPTRHPLLAAALD